MGVPRASSERAARSLGSPLFVNARVLYSSEEPPLRDLRQAVEILEEVSRMSSRVLGPRNPRTLRSEKFLGEAREKLARAADAPVARRTRSSKAEES